MSEVGGTKHPPAKKAKAKKPTKYVKNPNAPKRFKSAFIFFTMDRHRILRSQLEESKGRGDNTPDVAKMISSEWKALKPEERAVWEEKARLDKERYEVEKALYTGPWKIPAKRKAKKDSTAPKRPMSSFLSFSNSKRAEVKECNPGLTNAEASKILAKMWREAPEEKKREYIEREAQQREIYKREIAEWRAKKEQEESEIREKREEEAMDVVTGKTPFPPDRLAVYTGTKFSASNETSADQINSNDPFSKLKPGEDDTDDQDGDSKNQPAPPPVTPNQATATTAASATAQQMYYGQQHLYGYPHFPYQPPVMITPHSTQANRSNAAAATAAAAGTAAAATAAAAGTAAASSGNPYAYPGYNYGPTPSSAYYAQHYPYAQQYPPLHPQSQHEHDQQNDSDKKPPATK